MSVTEDIRKNLNEATPLYVVAGAADLAAEKLRELPASLEKLREEAPGRLREVRENELPKLRDRARELAEQGRETAREYAGKARETYEELAVRGRGAVEHWRDRREETAGETTGEKADAGAPEVTVERITDPAGASGDGTPGTGAEGR
ncbi:hypothetical protein GCM10027160_40660 [Streptomyces calidiresistens]|uniref:Uncharacterized protein n=1 Tax=Streptomyces calidiresistens TaxID=1485586 RepID=A0A7W3XW32_9ACTN|nr:hypothetical protein [Streptomyces calidiresistens]MBB0229312.1 hypothetical protein [Streptomyces calidiresistens]